jgi:hypothetical protein
MIRLDWIDYTWLAFNAALWGAAILATLWQGAAQ